MESSKVDRFLTKEGKGFGRRKDSAVYQDTRAKKTEKQAQEKCRPFTALLRNVGSVVHVFIDVAVRIRIVDNDLRRRRVAPQFLYLTAA